MINLNDCIVREYLRKSPRFKGEMNMTYYYKCYCDSCNIDKGYQSRSRYRAKPLCVKCATNTEKHKNILKKNHWKNKGASPKTWMTKDPSSPLRIRIGTNLRSRLNKAIKGSYKSGSAVFDLGCSIDEFRVHMESKFQLGMSWDNWGRKTWHIDHIRPISSFDLSDRDQLLEACHYTNLQPLWAKDNMMKSSRI